LHRLSKPALSVLIRARSIRENPWEMYSPLSPLKIYRWPQ
jgi:hypothetical protein